MLAVSLQMAVIESNRQAALDKAAEMIRRVKGADLIILPELWNIGFLCFDAYHSHAEGQDGPSLTRMRDLAREVKAYIHSGSFVEEDHGQYFNSSYLISPTGEILANYRKIHLFGFNSGEIRLLTPGKSLAVVKTPLGVFGLATCYDLRFPELFRAMADRGAEMFLVTSAWPFPRLEHWIMLNRVRAFENQAFLLSSNAAGFNTGVQLLGHSMAVNPWGTVVAGVGDQEAILKAELDLAEVKTIRERFPVLADRVEWLNKPIEQ